MLFEENEMNIAALYSLYAQKIPDKSAFWEKLSGEEIAHAASIGNKKTDEDQENSIIENKFSRGIIRYVMDFVLQETEKAQQGEISHEDALRTALRIERSVLEKKCFEMFSPSSEKIKAVFQRLNKDSERHVEVLLEEMKKNKFTP